MHADLVSDEVSRHKCLIYDGHPSAQLPVVVPLLLDGLLDNWRCMYLGSPDMIQMVGDGLSARGVDTVHETERGALVFSSQRDYLEQGAFVPQIMIDNLCTLTDAAVCDGFQGLCATGDMKWELGSNENFSRVLEYEALLEQLFRDKPFRGICQYHRDVVPAYAVHDALITHKSSYIGSAFNRDNLYYLPPEILLETRDSLRGSKQAEWMCQQIIRVLNAEEKRHSAVKALEESEGQQRRLAGLLAEANRDLEGRVADRTKELEIANHHLEAFSYSVSHDLRAPLQIILSLSELLLLKFGEPLGEEGRKHLRRVSQSAQHMGELINGLLTLGRVLKADLRRAPVNLSLLAESVAQEIRETQPERTVEWIIPTGLRAMGDSVLLRVVLTNLLSNAWKFTSKRSNGRIEVGKTQGETGVPGFFVRDNGVGFDMKNAEKLFGVFQRLHKQEEFPGTGVGLATVQRVISRHGGQIWAESHPGHETTFFFTLPMAKPHETIC